MPFPFALPTTSALSLTSFIESSSHPSLPLTASTYRGVLRDTLKKHKRLPSHSTTADLSNVLFSLNNYLPYLLALDAGLTNQRVAEEEVDVVLKSNPTFEWRPTLSDNLVPGREAIRTKLRSFEYELFFVLSTLAYAHTLLARGVLQPLYSQAAASPTSEQRSTAIATASKYLLTAASIHEYLAARSQQISEQAPCTDISTSVFRGLSSLALAEATLLAVLKDDPYPASVAQERNSNDKEWMIKAPDMPKVRAHLFARLCLAAADHAANAHALISGGRKVNESLCKYVEDLRRVGKAKACRFFSIDAEIGGQTGVAIAWLHASQHELGLTPSSKKSTGLGKLKKDWAEKREDKKIDKGDHWGMDAGRLEEARVVDMLEKKWTKMNNTRFQPNARISILVDAVYQREPPEIGGITFHVSNPYGGIGNYGASYQITEIYSWSFTMGVFTKDDALREFVKQQPAEPSVSSEAVFETARSWIAECAECHPSCSRSGQTGPGLPKRVLDLSTPLGHGKVRVYSNPGEQAPYATLSYCWGSTTQTKLKNRNLKSFMTEGITVSSLPQTIQDAITATRGLGIRYLWIDCLCIIQDSKEDKELEIAKMPQIFKNTEVTLSAAKAADCGDGFLQDRTAVAQRIAQSCRLPVRDDERENFPILGHMWLCADDGLGYQVKSLDDEPVSKRAWIMQEAWLSPRMLIYGSGPLKWRCLSSSAAYGNYTRDTDFQAQSLFENRRRFFEAQPTDEGDDSGENGTQAVGYWFDRVPMKRYEHWESLVCLYSRRSLTFSDDKLLALSGIASEFHRLDKDDYLAGLWRGSLPWALQWYEMREPTDQQPSWTDRIRRLKSVFVRPRRKPYVCPSWSFLASDVRISFKYEMFDQTETLVSIHAAWTTVATPSAPFGNVTDGAIEMTGPLTAMYWPVVSERFVFVTEGSAHLYWDYIVPDGGDTNEHIIHAIRTQETRFNGQYLAEDRIISLMDVRSRRARKVDRAEPPKGSPAALMFNPRAKHRPFWFLELTWTDTPTGIVMIQVAEATFKRIGFFRMGRNNDPNVNIINGCYVSGPRLWNWDAMLQMHRFKLI